MKRQPADLNEAILDIIESHTREHGYPPSIGDIARATKAGRATVHARLNQLQAEGSIVKEPGRARTIRIIRDGMADVTWTSVTGANPYPRAVDIRKD